MIVPDGSDGELAPPHSVEVKPLMISQRLDSPEFYEGTGSPTGSAPALNSPEKIEIENNLESGVENSSSDCGASGEALLPQEPEVSSDYGLENGLGNVLGNGLGKSPAGCKVDGENLRQQKTEIASEKGGDDYISGGCSAVRKSRGCLTLGPFWRGPLFHPEFLADTLSEVKLSRPCASHPSSACLAAATSSFFTPRDKQPPWVAVDEVTAVAHARARIGARDRRVVVCSDWRGERRAESGAGGPGDREPETEEAEEKEDEEDEDEEEEALVSPSTAVNAGSADDGPTQCGSLPSGSRSVWRGASAQPGDLPVRDHKRRRESISAVEEKGNKTNGKPVEDGTRAEGGKKGAEAGARRSDSASGTCQLTSTASKEPLTLSSRRQLIFLLEAVTGELADCPLFYSLTDVADYRGWGRKKNSWSFSGNGEGGGRRRGGRRGTPLPSVEDVRVRQGAELGKSVFNCGRPRRPRSCRPSSCRRCRYRRFSSVPLFHYCRTRLPTPVPVLSNYRLSPPPP